MGHTPYGQIRKEYRYLRQTRGALGVGQSLFTSERITRDTVGYWQFEARHGE